MHIQHFEGVYRHQARGSIPTFLSSAVESPRFSFFFSITSNYLQRMDPLFKPGGPENVTMICAHTRSGFAPANSRKLGSFFQTACRPICVRFEEAYAAQFVWQLVSPP